MLPREFPPWPTVYARFRPWRVSGTLRRAHDALRARVRVTEGRAPEASTAVIDSQSAKTTGAGGPARRYNGAKRLKGRKRHLLVDTTGLVLLACVHAADVHDREGARLLVESSPGSGLPRMQLVWADQGYTGAFASWLVEQRGWHLQVIRHPERQLRRYGLEEKRPHTFRVLPRHWVVERTFAWLGHARRLSKDYEHPPAVSEAMIYSAVSRLMLRRLTYSAA
jgi:putative transposase